jgi:hypothetical protein
MHQLQYKCYNSLFFGFLILRILVMLWLIAIRTPVFNTIHHNGIVSTKVGTPGQARIIK